MVYICPFCKGEYSEKLCPRCEEFPEIYLCDHSYGYYETSTKYGIKKIMRWCNKCNKFIWTNKSKWEKEREKFEEEYKQMNKEYQLDNIKYCLEHLEQLVPDELYDDIDQKALDIAFRYLNENL